MNYLIALRRDLNKELNKISDKEAGAGTKREKKEKTKIKAYISLFRNFNL